MSRCLLTLASVIQESEDDNNNIRDGLTGGHCFLN